MSNTHRSHDTHIEFEYTSLTIKDTDGEIVNWCHDTFGPQGVRWFNVGWWFYFNKPSDITLLTLKWQDSL